jgi:hypothetical protein
VAAIGNGDTGAFLTAMLEGEKGEKGKAGYILIGTIGSEDSAALA